MQAATLGADDLLGEGVREQGLHRVVDANGSDHVNRLQPTPVIGADFVTWSASYNAPRPSSVRLL